MGAKKAEGYRETQEVVMHKVKYLDIVMASYVIVCSGILDS
jgi:hypothetical protein